MNNLYHHSSWHVRCVIRQKLPDLADEVEINVPNRPEANKKAKHNTIISRHRKLKHLPERRLQHLQTQHSKYNPGQTRGTLGRSVENERP